jgi:iron-sulfur cluster assembly protein
MVQEVNGIRVFVDGFSAQYLSGVTVDYVTSMQGSGFTFTNPNAEWRVRVREQLQRLKRKR